MCCALLGLASPAVAASDDAPARDAPARVDRVLIISLPYLSWSDLDGRDDVPNITRLLDQSAVADLSVRAPSIRPDLAGGYATLSAGDKAVASGTADDGAGFEVDEHVGAGTARQAFARRTGTEAARGLVHLGLPQIVEANASTDFEAEVGALGDALEDAGYSRAVIANGDGVELPAPAPESDDASDEASRRFRRAAVAALMGADGTVPEGRVSKALLEDDADAAFGVRLDNDIVADAFAEVWKPKSVVLVEASDLVRADAYTDLVASDQRARVLTHALRASDALVGRLLDSVDPAATRSWWWDRPHRPPVVCSRSPRSVLPVSNRGCSGRARPSAPVTSSSWTWAPPSSTCSTSSGPTRCAGAPSKWATRAAARPTDATSSSTATTRRRSASAS